MKYEKVKFTFVNFKKERFSRDVSYKIVKYEKMRFSFVTFKKVRFSHHEL